MPAAAALAAVAMATAVGCVSVSPHAAPDAPPGRSRPAAPGIAQGPAREALVYTGPDGSDDLLEDPSRHAREGALRHAPGSAATDGPYRADASLPSFRGHRTDPSRPGGPPDVRSPHPDVRSPRPGSAGPSWRRERGEASPRRSDPSRGEPLPRYEPPPPPASQRQADPEPAREPRREAPAPAPAPRSGNGVCAAGRTYGQWQPNSDANRICGQVYGH
ncbi:hypothetical protein ACFQ2B_28840 [Streptomyces stramineus]